MAIVRKRGWGLGDANCPSLAQLMGVVDANDPCQQQSQIPSESPYPVVMTTSSGDNPQLAPASAVAGLQSWLKTNPAAMLGLGAALLVVVGGALMGGRRR